MVSPAASPPIETFPVEWPEAGPQSGRPASVINSIPEYRAPSGAPRSQCELPCSRRYSRILQLSGSLILRLVVPVIQVFRKNSYKLMHSAESVVMTDVFWDVISPI